MRERPESFTRWDVCHLPRTVVGGVPGAMELCFRLLSRALQEAASVLLEGRILAMPQPSSRLLCGRVFLFLIVLISA